MDWLFMQSLIQSAGTNNFQIEYTNCEMLIKNKAP